jgi:hypothetical protein
VNGRKFEAWLADIETVGMRNRVVEIEAGGVREAHRLAVEQCGDDEFVRGVVEITPATASDMRRAAP